jgi:hypothetical protein
MRMPGIKVGYSATRYLYRNQSRLVHKLRRDIPGNKRCGGKSRRLGCFLEIEAHSPAHLSRVNRAGDTRMTKHADSAGASSGLREAVPETTAAARVGHTPGPWIANLMPYRQTVWSANVLIAEVIQSDLPRREVRANTRMVAAAPDLMEAADNALGVLIGCCIPAGGIDDRTAILDAKRQLRAALVKARGES